MSINVLFFDNHVFCSFSIIIYLDRSFDIYDILAIVNVSSVVL